ncbi:MAG: threonine/serine exporter family protein [Clostridia bacterium]|nr:threonine/serine exporter family protein [Clostridia bacterium]
MEAMYMKALENAGRIIMENGGEAYRVEETVSRMGEAFGMAHVESFAIPSGIFISCKDHAGQVETMVLRVHRGGGDLDKVDRVNAISRQVVDGSISPEEACRQLEELHSLREDSRAGNVMAAAVAAFGFAFMFRGNLTDAVISAITAASVQLLAFLPKRIRIAGLSGALAGGFITALVPNLLFTLWRIGTTEAIVSGALMPLVPGVAMTNAVRDTLRGDIVSGVSHAA